MISVEKQTEDIQMVRQIITYPICEQQKNTLRTKGCH